jgi:hypothetical protein
MKKLFIVIALSALTGCMTVKGAIEAEHAAIALSACQQLGASPMSISSEDASLMYSKGTRITVGCSDDVNISFIIKSKSKKEQDI